MYIILYSSALKWVWTTIKIFIVFTLCLRATTWWRMQTKTVIIDLSISKVKTDILEENLFGITVPYWGCAAVN